jgi:hypothetical protein
MGGNGLRAVPPLILTQNPTLRLVLVLDSVGFSTSK